MNSKEWMEVADRCVMNTYARVPVVLVRGKGARLWDADGKEYLDFLAGISVCGLGHSHPAVSAAIARQAETLMHVSNIFHIEHQIRLARMLTELSFADKAFFCNSGAEANEAAIKLARRYSYEKTGGKRFEIITMINSFHGRTLATVAATGQERIRQGYDPLPAGFRHVAFNDAAALEAAISDETCAVMLEPIQAEGGIRVPAPGYLRQVRDICDSHGLLLIYDEVQVGMGRTGTLFAYEESGVEPDIMTLAKALGSGFPVGAMLARDEVASAFVPGSHASTFGGNPLAMAAALATLETMIAEGVVENARTVGDYFLDRLRQLAENHDIITGIRGRGLMVGLELSIEGAPCVMKALEQGLLMNCTAGTVLRFVPPLIITRSDVDEAVGILDSLLGQV
ncbi:MAG: acetylornithine transaminase [Syntrophales bacterium]|jgi:predicted acetylornithine/succinylornithine family transaminase|nr:acetylornithine transaminase [Syntrophales bacterium]MCK9528081.1 acetylornithine transaminase [Syntrophales bacterium]MDX9922323.1 acetylornithine transaminase [Syntrophales bacterium]